MWRLLTPRRTRCPRFTQDARQGNGPPDSISIHNGQPGRPRRTVRARSAITLPPIALVRPARRARSGVSSTRRDPGPPECPPDELRFACRKVAHHLDLMRQAWREGDAKQLDLIGSGIGSETGYFEHLMRCEIRAEVHRLREKLEHDLDYLPLILPHVEPRLRDRLCRLMSALDLDRSVATDEGERTAWRLIWTALGLDSEVNELISILKAEGDRLVLQAEDRGDKAEARVATKEAGARADPDAPAQLATEAVVQREGSPVPSNKMSKRVKRSGGSLEWLASEQPSFIPEGRATEAERKSQHEYIREHGCPAYPDDQIPSFESWARYLREYVRLTEGQRNTPRAGRTGRSMVRPDGSRHDAKAS